MSDADAVRRWATAIAAWLTLVGCEYTQEKALREYDAALDPARVAIRQVQATQPSLAERRSPERLRTIARKQLLPAVDLVLARLEAVHPSDTELQTHHLALMRLWQEYRQAIDEYADGLTGATLPSHRAALQLALERLWSEFRAWQTSALALEDSTTNWG